MLYALDLHALVDESDEPYAYFRFHPVDPELLEWPELSSERFDACPHGLQALTFDPDDEGSGGFPAHSASPLTLVSIRLRRVQEGCGLANIGGFATIISGADVFKDCPEYFVINVIGTVSVFGDRSITVPRFGTLLMAAMKNWGQPPNFHRVANDFGGVQAYLVDVLGVDAPAQRELAGRCLQRPDAAASA